MYENLFGRKIYNNSKKRIFYRLFVFVPYFTTPEYWGKLRLLTVIISLFICIMDYY